MKEIRIVAESRLMLKNSSGTASATDSSRGLTEERKLNSSARVVNNSSTQQREGERSSAAQAQEENKSVVFIHLSLSLARCFFFPAAQNLIPGQSKKKVKIMNRDAESSH